MTSANGTLLYPLPVSESEPYPEPEVGLSEGETLKRQLYQNFALYFVLLDAILIVPTVMGNGLIIIAVAKFKTLRNSKAYILVGNLAVSDLCVGLIQVPMDLLAMKWHWASSNKTFCLWHQCLSNAFLGASVMNLLLMSIERFHAIKYPLEHNFRFTRKLAIRLIIASWLFITLVSFVPFFGWYNQRHEEDFVCKTDELFKPEFRILFSAIMVLSLFTNFILFVIVVRITLKNREAMFNRSTGAGVRLQKDLNYTKLMLLISGLFCVCWGPYCCLSLSYFYTQELAFLRCVFSSFGLINSGLNWLIYGVRNVKIRRALKVLLTCQYNKLNQLKSPGSAQWSTRMSELM